MFNFERRPISSFLGALFGGILIVFAAAMFVWGLTTNFSYWWGQQGVEQQQNSTGNYISSQQQFFRDKNDFDAFVNQKIPVAKAALADFDKAHQNLAVEDPLTQMQDSQRRAGLVDDLGGVRLLCVSTAGSYNTAAKAALSAKWRDSTLPESLDPAECWK